MKKLLFIGLSILFMVCSSYSQNDSLYGFYYANGTRHYWQEDFTSANIIVRNINHYDSIATSLRKVFNSTDDVVLADDEDNNIIVNSQSLASRNISELISSISLSNNDIAFFTFAKQVDGNPIWLTNEVYVKLKDNDYYVSHIQPILSQYPNVISYYEGENEYRFVCPTDSVVATLANRLYDTAFVVYSSPDYYSLGELYNNDTYYSDQWNLNNTGQNGGTIGVDIKAEKAWAFLQKEIGSSGGNVKIAVIDDGVEEHEDFYEEHGVCVVLEGYTANGDGTGRPRPKNKHGECCAGVISAVHNNIGIAGVAPHSRIIPIRIFRNISNSNSKWYMFPSQKVARAIKKSWEEFGASVLSCSWGSSNPNDVINDAIVEAATNGRDGKGCIICFSSGNKAVYSIEQSVAAEAALYEVLAVGAIYANGMRHGESCYGLELDLVAPGYAIPTLDREGDYGETNGDYFLEFQRTSAACPHVSGVAALILSVRPELTREEIYGILESTAQKVGNYDYNYNNYHPNGTWNQEVGHGLVDAHMAVVEASLYGREVSLLGEEQLDLCDETTYTCSIYHPDNFYFEWSFSENLAIVSHINSTARVMPIATGDAFIQVDVYSEKACQKP